MNWRVLGWPLPASSRFAAFLGTAWPRLLARLRSVQRSCRFVLVRSSGQASGFATDGDELARLRFTRLYLQSTAVRLSSHYCLRDRSRAVLTLRNRMGLVVCHDPPPDLRGHLLRVPRFVQLRLDLRSDPQSFLAALPPDRRQRIRRLEAKGFHVVFCRDASWAEHFHARFHAPSVRRSHGSEGYVMSADEIFQSVKSGGSEFLQIFLGSQCIAAGTRRQIGSTYHLERPGWLDGDPCWLKQGVQVARVWYAAERARALGCRELALGGTPPVLEDGVFRFKARWGAQIDLDGSRWGDHYLLIDPGCADVQRFLSQTSLLIRGDHGRLLICSTRSAAAIQLPPLLQAQIDGIRRLRSPAELTSRQLAGRLDGACMSDWFQDEPIHVTR